MGLVCVNAEAGFRRKEEERKSLGKSVTIKILDFL